MGQALVLKIAQPATGLEPENSRPGLVSVAGNPTPADATLQWLDSSGVQLRCARWPASTKQVRGTVCLIQGRTEYIEKYYEVIADLRGRGFAVLAARAVQTACCTSPNADMLILFQTMFPIWKP